MIESKGTAVNHLGDYADAIPYFDKALAIDPNFKAALQGKQNVLSRIGNRNN
ncbi:MAG: hypothetical protein ACTHKP_16525 [Nitrososphaeraceae archaeon]